MVRMFKKKISRYRPPTRCRRHTCLPRGEITFALYEWLTLFRRSAAGRLITILCAGLLLALPGCPPLPPLPKVNLSEPGWETHQGQAVWRSRRGAPEIAGEI